MGYDPMVELLDDLDREERDVRAEDREQEDPGSSDWYPDWKGPSDITVHEDGTQTREWSF